MNVAAGKYIFFMEGDDAIHPLLLEVLVRQAAGNLAEITLCEYTRLYGQWFEKILNLTSEVDEAEMADRRSRSVLRMVSYEV